MTERERVEEEVRKILEHSYPYCGDAEPMLVDLVIRERDEALRAEFTKTYSPYLAEYNAELFSELGEVAKELDSLREYVTKLKDLICHYARAVRHGLCRHRAWGCIVMDPDGKLHQPGCPLPGLLDKSKKLGVEV